MLTPEEIMTLKESIYSVLTDKEILSYYLGLSYSTIDKLLEHRSNRISNPLRFDENPSLGMRLRYSSYGDRIITKDFADPSYNGDIFDIIGVIKNLNSNSRDGFIAICNMIMTDLVLSNEDITIIPVANKTNTVDAKVVYHNDKIPFIMFTDKGWSNTELRFWHNHTKNKTFTKHLFDILRLEYVFIADAIFSNDKAVYSYKSTDIAYVYSYGTNHLGNSIIKAYFPYRNRGYSLKTTRFFTNDTAKYRALRTNTNDAVNMVMTKSMKDALFIRTFLNFANLQNSVNIYYVQGEENYLLQHEMDTLLNQYSTLIWFMDFDKTGIYNTYYHMMFSPSVKPLFIAGKEVDIKINDLTYTISKINKQFGTNYNYNVLQLFIDQFPVRPYFKGVKDFADILEVKSLNYTIKYFKLLVKTYLNCLLQN